MIITPEHLIKQYFPEPIETTKDLYERLALKESGYPYLNWLKDLEEHCLTKYVEDSEYKLLPEEEKNYWISAKAFRVIIQSSPSKICDEIRACYIYISKKVAEDPAFARKLQDQLDEEAGIPKVIPKVSNKLKLEYNQTGQDAFEFSLKDDRRLHMDIVSGYNFQPDQKINHVSFAFKFEEEQGVPFHVIDVTLSFAIGQTLSYQTIWNCNEEREKYGAIFMNKIIRVNLFGDNKKLVDSYDYILGVSEVKQLETELEKAIAMLIDINLDEVDIDELREKILSRQ